MPVLLTPDKFDAWTQGDDKGLLKPAPEGYRFTTTRRSLWFAPTLAASTGISYAVAQVATGGTCGPDFRIWQVGLKNTWSPAQNLDLGIEFDYTKLEQQYSGSTGTLGGNCHVSGK